jgi:DNA-binding MurR/RpiR family transcriptional regulator
MEHLALNGFTDLRERMQELMRGQLSRTGDPISESPAAGHLEGTSFGASLSHDWQNLHHTIAGLDAAAFDRAVNALARARGFTWSANSQASQSRIILR